MAMLVVVVAFTVALLATITSVSLCGLVVTATEDIGEVMDTWVVMDTWAFMAIGVMELQTSVAIVALTVGMAAIGEVTWEEGI